MSPTSTFTSIPILDLSLARDAQTKPAFLADLRHALLTVGFLYITNTGIPPDLISTVISQTHSFFSLPMEEKLRIEMKNANSFLGYSRLDNEITAHKIDHREQLDLSTPHPLPAPGSPLYKNLLAPNQWPSPTMLPTFRPIFEDYITRMSHLATEFTSLIAESIGLPATAFDRFFDKDQQHKLKLVKYPDTSTTTTTLTDDEEKPITSQGVGPHKDSMLTSYLLQATPHRGLQAQNATGDWIDCPPLPSTLIVAIGQGQGLEAITAGVCRSTTHRVVSPAAGSGARYSIPFFQGVSYDAKFESMEGWIPEEVLGLRSQERRGGGDSDGGVEFTFKMGRWDCLGEATLANRVKSHRDVGEVWYPELLREVG
ncbi:MAG: hypothetical protein M1834_007677 [Cirrosporium novae-zelandiae]|nr:MAG: hypothetical protein M1834_007677 [Cirrosporium novae-zelandiae]